jgi:hypothetical protein
MKLILPLFFILIPVLANCQTSKPGADAPALPALNREWNCYDFLEVYKIIIASQNGAPEGIISIETNAPLIAKLTNIENYEFLSSKDYTIPDRINFCDSLQRVSKVVFLNYYQKSKLANGRIRYEREITGFIDIMLRVTMIEMGIIDDVLNATPNRTQKQIDGLKQFMQGITTMENGALLTMEKEYQLYSEASICKLSKTFKEFYTVMYSKLEADVKTEFDRRIASMIKTHPLPCVRTALQGEKK